jgi:hypothetical protein
MDQGSGQFHFNPETYLDMVISEVPAYEELEDRTAEATLGIDVDTILALGTGTGETAVFRLGLSACFTSEKGSNLNAGCIPKAMELG